jgi:hypothetical protein
MYDRHATRADYGCIVRRCVCAADPCSAQINLAACECQVQPGATLQQLGAALAQTGFCCPAVAGPCDPIGSLAASRDAAVRERPPPAAVMLPGVLTPRVGRACASKQHQLCCTRRVALLRVCTKQPLASAARPTAADILPTQLRQPAAPTNQADPPCWFTAGARRHGGAARRPHRARGCTRPWRRRRRGRGARHHHRCGGWCRLRRLWLGFKHSQLARRQSSKTMA